MVPSVSMMNSDLIDTPRSSLKTPKLRLTAPCGQKSDKTRSEFAVPSRRVLLTQAS